MIEECVPRACLPKSEKTSPGSVIGIPFQIPTVSGFSYSGGNPFYLAYDWPTGGKISELRINARVGSGTCSIYINGVVVEGLDTVAVTAGTRAEHRATGANTFVPGDDITLKFIGTGTLSDVRGTLVVTNCTIYGLIEEQPSGLVHGVIPITAGLAGDTEITLAISPLLRRDPIQIFAPVFTKGADDEANVFCVGVTPITEGDYRGGWKYHLNGGAIEGQILRYSYLK